MITATAVQPHPLSTLLSRHGLTAAAYLKRVADRHLALGFGAMAHRKEKVTRWTREGVTPEKSALLAIASLHDIDFADVDRYGWPGFLLLALDDDRTVLESPWTAAGTVTALTEVGGPVKDRRGFLIASTATLASALAQWLTAEPALAIGDRGRRVGAEAAALFDVRLDALRHLDDTVGAGQVYDAAVLELRLVADLLKNASYSEATGRRLFASAAEASRLAGWCAYDEGRHAAAERHFVASLRASSSAQDPTLGAVTLAFWANLRYNADDSHGALHLLDGALADRRKISSPRVKAMLHARAARAHSKAGEPLSAWRQVDAAFDAYAKADAPDADLASMYWINHGELHQVAASSALSLGEPRRALENFHAALTHADPYDTDREARGAVIYQVREAEAHLALGDVDAALDLGHQVIHTMGGIDSARTTSTLDELRGQLTGHRHVPAVADFLNYAA
ncbi:MFS transporter [Streptomyces filipinensis]|uniref:MFS transporter n=1 Tax=Streptomyces filipinensis TaxID=66887 RepID=A0A918MGH1_9ACTN|nr:transcriptional regulator [Streptomyces filipinensis]GGV29000.1 MFS transporter [Streptomyces filipinensis]